MHPAAPLAEDAGLNITLISHDAVIDLSVCVCPDNVPAVNEIATGIAESLDVLAAAAQIPSGARPFSRHRNVDTRHQAFAHRALAAAAVETPEPATLFMMYGPMPAC